MPLPFADLCTLLTRYEDLEQHEPPILRAADKAAQQAQITTSWFRSRRRAIHDASVAETVALLSALLPERRVDRVYELQTARLARVLGRALRLTASRAADLNAYTRPGTGDLAVCLERVLCAGGPPALPAVTLEEVDGVLAGLAGCSRFSGPGVRGSLPSSSASSELRESLLAGVLLRFQSFEAKWFVRLVLKDFSPVRIDERQVLSGFHFLLPDLLRFQNDFAAVVSLLKGPLREYPDHPDPRSERLHRLSVARLLAPVVGVKVGRPDFVKARSIDHCMGIIGKQAWVLERKYDGEYCEVHVDLTLSSAPSECIKIFSKSGKESTTDRKAILQALVDSLQLGTSECKIKRQAILLGELVVYSDRSKTILPFEEIRKHVARSGSFIGTNADSTPSFQEHLAIVFFDLLLLDKDNIMSNPVEDRRTRLRQVYHKIPGRVMGAEWKIVDFQQQELARKRLIEQFAASIARRCEGLILKPCGVPYFPIDRSTQRHCFIKLKKDYMADFGDEADFAVIGASYSAQQALRNDHLNVKWTTFHLGCLTNKDDVLRFNSRPCFRVVGTISHETCIPNAVSLAVNALAPFIAQPYDPTTPPANFDFDRRSLPKLDVSFSIPFVFEVLGAGYEKPSNASFLMLRHARVKKLHRDRSWRDCVSFQELQILAATARDAPVTSESQETLQWIAKLERKCRRKAEREVTESPRSTGVRSAPASQESCHSRRLGTALGGHEVLATSLRASTKRTPDGPGATPCPPGKRKCIQAVENVPGEDQSTGNDSQAPTRPSPLSDITTTALNSAPKPGSQDLGPPRGVEDLQKGLSDPIPFISSSLTHFFQPLPSYSPYQTPPSSTSSCRDSTTCLFANAAVFLTPCIATTLYITHDLLPSHHATPILSLHHWAATAARRKSAAPTDERLLSPPPSSPGFVLPESQPYANQRRLVLVESKRQAAVREVVRQILALRFASSREEEEEEEGYGIEVWDWRVLEASVRHDFDRDANGSMRKLRLGSTVVCGPGEKGMRWVAECEWLAEFET